MPTRDELEEAQLEISIAKSFGYKPPAWAVELIEGSGSAAGRAKSRDQLIREALRQSGFDEPRVDEAMRRLASGSYVNVQDVVLNMMAFDSSNQPRRIRMPLLEDLLSKIPGNQPVTESRPVSRAALQESAVATRTGDARFSVCLISEGQGTSGYYPAATLAEAAKSGVFRKGLHCYLDHEANPTGAVRSVRDLAGVLEAQAAYRDGALYADVQVFAPFGDFIDQRQSAIGMSIRGEAEVSESADSRVRVVERITIAYSVDFVTAAGRGGHIVTRL